MRIGIKTFFHIIYCFIFIIISCTNYKVIEDKVKKVKIGMNKQEVVELTGDPEFKRSVVKDSLIVEERWYFKSSMFKSTPPEIIFDRNTGLVIEVLCGENYRIYKK